MKTRCSCEGKVFPHAFRKDEIIMHCPEWHENEFYCIKCKRHLGDEFNGVDEEDPDWCPCPATGKRLSGQQYIDLYKRFHEK